MALVFHRGRALPLDDVIGSSCRRCCTCCDNLVFVSRWMWMALCGRS